MTSTVNDPPTSTATYCSTTVNTADAVPFIVRIAGLPASVALAFRSDRCREEMENVQRLSQELASLRAKAVDKLFSVVPEVPPEMRKSLLAVKRDCFNRREIRHHDPSSLERLRPWIGDVVACIVAHEEQLAALEEKFDDIYAEARDQVRELLLRLGEDLELRRGLTLASRDLIENHRRLAKKSYALYGRKERSAERSLARYVIRATVKLSPYSTLTRLGLGCTVSQASSRIRLLSRPWEQRSLVRLKSYLPNQWVALLLRIPRIREGLQIDLNDTLEDLGDGRHRLLRPWMLQWNEENQDLKFVKPSLAKVRLGGPLIDWLKGHLSDGPVRYAKLCTHAAMDLGAKREEVASIFDQFLDIGVLKLLPPWPTYEPYLERRTLEFLETSPVAAFTALDPVRQLLRRLVEAQTGYATADSPATSIDEIERLAPEIFVALKKVLAPSSELTMEKGRQDIYEDVLMHVAPGTCHSLGGEILHMSRAKLDELFEAGDLLWRIRGLYERRHECLHAFWHVAREQWPAGTQVPCLRFFAALENTWKLYVDHLVNGGEGLFNPYDLETVRELGALRTGIIGELVRTLEAHDDGYHLPAASLRRLLTRIPLAYQAPVGPCLIVQPADSAGELWVAHRLGDGSGRYSSRFSTLMQEPLRDWFTGHFTARSLLTVEGEPTELLDLIFTQLTTVNRHWPQTYKVLETPGEAANLPAHRVVRPADLFIEIGESSGELRMRDRDGRRYLPCFLSALHTAWIPTFIKFLTIFGIETRGGLDIPAPIEREGSIEHLPRLTVGRLVFRRKRWIVPVSQIPRSAESEAAAFTAVWNWRRAVGLPERIFWIERLRPKVEGIKLFKPQFIDFNSPTLVSLLLAGLEGKPEGELTTFEEALPTPEAFPTDDSGEGWGTELTLEGIAFQKASRSKEELEYIASPYGED
jgi:hypothetical protein